MDYLIPAASLVRSKLLATRPEKFGLNLSVSKTKTFKDCQAKFHYSYIQKLPKKDWQHLAFGSFCHEVLELFHKRLLAEPSIPEHKAMAESFKIAHKNWKAKLTAEDTKAAQDLLQKYLQDLQLQTEAGTRPTILALEEDFFVNIDNKVLLNGFIDRIQRDPDGMLHVSDYKTSKSDFYLKKDLFQLQTYAYVLFLKDPTLQRIRGSYILLKLDMRSVVFEFEREDCLKMEKTFLDYADQIEQEKLWRAKTSPLCEYCDYLEKCTTGIQFVLANSKTPEKFEYLRPKPGSFLFEE